MDFYQCRDCKQSYDFVIDKCVNCGGDYWRKLTIEKYVSILKDKVAKLEALIRRGE